MRPLSETYDKALKEVRATKPKEMKALIKFDYNNTYVLPFKAAIQFMEAMEHAEHLSGSYGSPHGIQPLIKDHFSMHPFSGEEYEANKIAALLNVSVDEVRQYKNNLDTE